MRLVLTQKDGSTKSFPVRVHGKKPSYFDAAEKSREVELNGEATKMVVHPKRESSNRVNFVGTKPDTWLFVDNDELHAMITANSKARLSFATAEGRAPKAAAEATEQAAEAAAA